MESSTETNSLTITSQDDESTRSQIDGAVLIDCATGSPDSTKIDLGTVFEEIAGGIANGDCENILEGTSSQVLFSS